jgi:Astacin (Peptidase family M12A)/Bacterial tandem repeat domain 1
MSDQRKRPGGQAPGGEMASSDDIRSGYLTGPGVYRLPVQYSVVDGIALFGGCIDLGPVEEVEAEAARIHAEAQAGQNAPVHGEEDAPVLQGVGLPSDSQFLWPNGRVPYEINAALPNQARVTDAIAHIEARSAIRFILRTPANALQHPNWVEFIPHPSVNSSPVGMRGGRQQIRLSPGATMGTAVHEILHSLGIYHEQSRSDRDNFIEIRWQNIQPEAVHNFQTVPGAVDYYDYDYGSIMHYPRWAFSSNNQDTIVPRQSGVTIGQRDGLSFGDRLTIAKIYERFFTNGYSGVWRANTGRYGLWVNATWDSFQAKWQEWSGQDLRLIDIHTRHEGGETRYSGVFREGSGGYALWANASFDSFQQKWQEWAGQGLRLVGVHVHRSGSENRYSGVWLPGSGGYGLWVDASWESFQAKWQEWNQQGLRLVDIHVHRVDGQNRYSGVWLAGTGGYGLWANATWDSFRAKWQEWSGQGLRLVDMALHRANGENRYSGVWRQGTGGYYLWANVTWESFRAKWEQLGEQGLQLVDYDFPAPEVGLFGDVDTAGLADAEVDRIDPGLALDGFGGVFGERPAELPVAAAPGALPMEPIGVGGLVGVPEDASAGTSAPDGQGEAVMLAPNGPAGPAEAAETEGLGGSGGYVGAAQPGEGHDGPARNGGGGPVLTH